MAIYHFSGKTVSRSQGRSAIAASAYRSASILYDERYGKTHNYSHKQDVIFSEILIPEHAPAWMKEREKLWNSVELSEKRKDAQLAREIEFSLPRELTNNQNITLAREFIQTQFVDKGMVADWSFHIDKATDGEPHPHVHVMLTMRAINADGFGQKVRAWNQKEILLGWRQSWSEHANRHLSLNGHDLHIDHRSHAERGIALEPQYKIGSAVARDRMARLEDHHRIARENGEKLFSDTRLALDSLTQQQSTFTLQELAKFVHRHTENTEQFQKVYHKIKADGEIVFLGMDAKNQERYTTCSMLSLEKKMVEEAQQLHEKEGFVVSRKLPSEDALSKQQQLAVTHLTDKGNIKCVIGYAGSGKSHMLKTCRHLWEAEGYSVKGATLSGIAAENLEKSSGIESRTLASRLYYWERGKEPLTGSDILVVDEAGMVGSRHMAKVIEEVHKYGAKLVLIGDPSQLQAIDAGAAFRAISERTGSMDLTEIRRQKESWQREATREFAKGRIQAALGQYREKGHLHGFETQAMAKSAMVEAWNETRLTKQTPLMLAYTRKDVRDLNEMAREKRRGLGELKEDHALQTDQGEKLFAVHDRVYFTQNDRMLGVKNGTLGMISSLKNKTLTIEIEGKEAVKVVTVDLEKYNHLTHGYAVTIHKSQGITVDHTYVLASRHMDRHIAYVGMSRHRERADLYYSREDFQREQDLGLALSRDRSKDISVDYELSRHKEGGNLSLLEAAEKQRQQEIKAIFSEKRGIEIDKNFMESNLSFKRDQTIYWEEPEKSRGSDLMQEFGFSPQEVERYSRECKRDLADDFSFSELHQDDEFREFKQAYEREHPELAKALSQEIKPAFEKRADVIEKKFCDLQRALQKDPQSREIKHALRKLAVEVSKDSLVINHFKERSPELKQKIDALNHQHERQRVMRRERQESLGLSY